MSDCKNVGKWDDKDISKLRLVIGHINGPKRLFDSEGKPLTLNQMCKLLRSTVSKIETKMQQKLPSTTKEWRKYIDAFVKIVVREQFNDQKLHGSNAYKAPAVCVKDLTVSQLRVHILNTKLKGYRPELAHFMDSKGNLNNKKRICESIQTTSGSRGLYAAIATVGTLAAASGAIYKARTKKHNMTPIIQRSTERSVPNKLTRVLDSMKNPTKHTLPVQELTECKSKYVIDYTSKIGSGKYGAVYISCEMGDCSFATKVQTDERAFHLEVEAYRKLHESKVTPRVREVYLCTPVGKPTIYCIVMDKMEKSLGQLVLEEKFEKNDECFISRELYSTLVNQLIHIYDVIAKKRVLYTDWHVQNILVDSQGNLKLVDFGLDLSNEPDPKSKGIEIIQIHILRMLLTLVFGVPSELWYIYQHNFNNTLNAEDPGLPRFRNIAYSVYNETIVKRFKGAADTHAGRLKILNLYSGKSVFPE